VPKKSDHDRTVTRSFRISEKSLKALEEEAHRQNISVGTLVNQQLLSYAEFERYFRRLGLIKISLSTFQRVLKAATDDGIAIAGAETGSDNPRSIILAKHGELNLNSVIDYLTILSEFGGLFEFGEVEVDGKRMITLLHSLGPRGSVFFSNYMKALFEGIDFTPRITSSEHSVLVEITPRKDQSATV
jgi:hypothetical protein